MDADLKQYLEAMEGRLNTKFDAARCAWSPFARPDMKMPKYALSLQSVRTYMFPAPSARYQSGSGGVLVR